MGSSHQSYDAFPQPQMYGGPLWGRGTVAPTGTFAPSPAQPSAPAPQPIPQMPTGTVTNVPAGSPGIPQFTNGLPQGQSGLSGAMPTINSQFINRLLPQLGPMLASRGGSPF